MLAKTTCCVFSARSAGGTGVLLNVDRVAELLEGLGHTGVQVRGLSDSGWFLDNKQYHCTDCVDTVSCAPTETIKRGIKYARQQTKCRKMWRRRAVDETGLTISVPSHLLHQVLGWSGTREVQASPRRRGVELFLWIQSLPINKKSVSAFACELHTTQMLLCHVRPLHTNAPSVIFSLSLCILLVKAPCLWSSGCLMRPS